MEDGRKLWGDVVGRWRKGDLIVDQPLVCAMGRLLLLGSRRSRWEDVFALVEQTMNIPRWKPGTESETIHRCNESRVDKTGLNRNVSVEGTGDVW